MVKRKRNKVITIYFYVMANKIKILLYYKYVKISNPSVLQKKTKRALWKASAYLQEQGFTNVKQLHGGIHEYGEKAGGKYFEGEMFVFDKRLHIPINRENPITITHCIYCNQSITRYIDCSFKSCESLFICCEACQYEHNGACSSTCEQMLT